MSTSYKTAKEAFVSHTTGSTITEVNLICAVSLASLILHYVILARTAPNLFIEWVVLILPLLLSMTIMAEEPVLLSSVLLLAAGIICILPPCTPVNTSNASLPSLSSTNNIPSRPSSPSHSIRIAPSPPQSYTDSTSPNTTTSNNKSTATVPIRLSVPPLPALTTYRAHMMLMTILGILAVDFPVFPRSLAKCESFGVSLMDLGVGSFVFSQGIVSALPLLKDPTYLIKPTLPKLITSARKMAPVFLLGIIRVLMVKGTEYPEHASEYGTHWNFFFTLAILPPVQILLHPILLYAPISFVGIIIGIVHQILLSATSLQEFTLNAPRTTLFSHNKEGVVSLLGYLSIHLLGLSLGTVILPSSPSDFRRAQKRLRSVKHFANRTNNCNVSHKTRNSDEIHQDDSAAQATSHFRSDSTSIVRKSKSEIRQNDKTVTELCAYAVLWWVGLAIAAAFVKRKGDNGAVSRRLANLPYVLWITAFNTSFIVCYILLDMVFSRSSKPTSARSEGTSADKLSVPNTQPAVESSSAGDNARSPLLDAINRGGLVVFLLANLLTGLVNVSMKTMYASNNVALAVLSAYSYVLCVAALESAKRWPKGLL